MSEAAQLPRLQTFSTSLGEFAYAVTPQDGEEQYGVFPAAIHFDERSGTYAVRRNDRTVNTLYEVYGSELVSRDAIEKLYIGTSLIDGFGIETMKRRPDLQEDLWQTMSSPDSLNRQVLDLPSERFQRSLFTYLGEELSPQIPRINGLRFAAGVLYGSHPELFEEVRPEMLRALKIRMLGQEQQFIKIARVFTRGLNEARTAFSETIPLYEIAFALPMDKIEVGRVTELMQGNA